MTARPAGAWIEIRSRHVRQRRRAAANRRRACCRTSGAGARMPAREAGHQRLRPAAAGRCTTFRKLPMIAPNRPAATSGPYDLRHGAAAAFAGSFGSGQRRRRIRSTPDRRDRYGTPAGSTGMPPGTPHGPRVLPVAWARTPVSRANRLQSRRQRIDLIERVELRQRGARLLRDIQPLLVCQSDATAGATTAGCPRRGWRPAASATRRAGRAAALANHLPRRLVVVVPPVMNEADVLHVFPAAGSALCLFQQPMARSGPSRAAGIRLGEGRSRRTGTPP